MSYYSAKVSLAVDTAKGVKTVTEVYLVDAASVTHAAALVFKEFEGQGQDIEVKSVTKSKIVKVLDWPKNPSKK